MATLGIEPAQLIEGAYVDLLAQRGLCNQAIRDQSRPGR
jgi:hypothetical protein